MSRIGKRPIEIPKSVDLKIDSNGITIKGKHGILTQTKVELLDYRLEENKLYITRLEETSKAKEVHGLIRAIIQNKVIGVDQKFSKTLIAEGVGYKFQTDKKMLIANVGFTHPVEFSIPEDLEIKNESPIKIIISGIDKEKVGFLAAKIRDIRPPEPYKGKGILYEGEIIRRKAGKTGK